MKMSKTIVLLTVAAVLAGTLLAACRQKAKADPSEPETSRTAETMNTGAEVTETADTQTLSDAEIRQTYRNYLFNELPLKTAERFRKDDQTGNDDGIKYGEYYMRDLRMTLRNWEFGDFKDGFEAQYAILDLPLELPEADTKTRAGKEVTQRSAGEPSAAEKVQLDDDAKDGSIGPRKGTTVPVLVLNMQSRSTPNMSWNGFITYAEDEGLVLQNSYQFGNRTYATLYDTGYLIYEGSNGAGDYATAIARFDGRGERYDLCTMRELYAGYAASWIWEISPDGQGPKGEYTELSGEFMMRTCTMDDAHYMQVASHAKSEIEKKEETQLLAELQALGVKEISEAEMDAYFDLEKYREHKVLWTLMDGPGPEVMEHATTMPDGNVDLDALEATLNAALSGGTNGGEHTTNGDSANADTDNGMDKEDTMNTGNMAMTGMFIDGSTLSAAERASMIVLEDDQYSMVAKLQATAAIRDLRIYTLEMDFSETEGIRFRGTQRSQVPALQAGQAIYLKLSFPGDSPHHGVSYVDAGGTTHYISLMQSGFDGSLALGEETPFK